MKLTDAIHMLRIDFEIALSPEKQLQRFVNSIIIFGNKITIIDTGVKNSYKQIFEYIEQNNRKISDIKTVILSHSHPDHIGSAKAIQELTGCKILAHKGEKDWIENINLQNKERQVPGFYTLVDSSITLDGLLEHGQILSAGKNITLKVIHAPGHSKGSLNILFKEDNILFTADSIPLKNDIPNYDNYKDLAASLEMIKKYSDASTLLTSWTPPLTNPNEIQTLLAEGEEYIQKIDNVVKKSYAGKEVEPLSFCRKALNILGLPAFLTMPIVDKALQSHIFDKRQQ
jgi:glyoxylase-like metal-dependent hydrolase (beta-lactamase superfamily II)